MSWLFILFFFFFQAEDGIRDKLVTGVQTCALPISPRSASKSRCAPPWSRSASPALTKNKSRNEFKTLSSDFGTTHCGAGRPIGPLRTVSVRARSRQILHRCSRRESAGRLEAADLQE